MSPSSVSGAHVAYLFCFIALSASAGTAHSNDERCIAGEDFDDTHEVSMLQTELRVSKLVQEPPPLRASRADGLMPVERKRSDIKVGLVGAKGEVTKTLQDISCIEHTGGTCLVQQCAAWRGPTTCSVGRCFCAPGYCSSANGECIKKTNEIVGKAVTLRNARYPDQVMYISMASKVQVSSVVDSSSLFNLHRLPEPERFGNSTEFLLGSSKWTGWVAAIQQREECSSTHDREYSGCETVIETAARPVKMLGTSTQVADLAITLFAAPPYDGEPNDTQSVMISSYEYSHRYFSLGAFSYGVGATRGDAGAGSYWIVEPALPVSLPPYRGPRCSFDCGSYGSGTSRFVKVLGVVGIVVASSIGGVALVAGLAASWRK